MTKNQSKHMKKPTTKPNIALLRKIQKAILKYPDQFNMDWWFDVTDSTGNPAGRCGTAACIGGWAVALSPKFKGKKLNVISDAVCDVSTIGGKLLRIPVKYIRTSPMAWDKNSRHKLFFHDQWPAKFKKRYDNASTAKEAAQAAADRISYFIKTGK